MSSNIRCCKFYCLDNFQFSKETKLLTTNHGGGELLLCLNIDCNPGLEVDGEVILEDGDLGDVP